MSRLQAALFASEPWYKYWLTSGHAYARARSVVLFDRILTGNERRILVNGQPLILGAGVDK